MSIVPKSGMILPEMGRKGSTTRRSGLADALFTPVQQRVLRLLFAQPERTYQSAELIRLAQGGVGAVHRQLARLTSSGLVNVTRRGNQKYYQANRDVPVFEDLHGLIVKTVGLVEPLRRALGPESNAIRAAFVYGSVAKGTDRAGSDIDLMVISDSLTYQAVFQAAQEAETALARSISPTVMTLARWHAKLSKADSFVAKVASGPRIFVIGSDDDLR